MSSQSERITPIEVRDPRTVLKQHRLQPILKSGSQITYAHVDSVNYDTNNITFNCNPPSGNTIIDRKVFVSVPVRLSITGTVGAGAQGNGTTCIRATADAIRAFPLSGSVSNLTVTINNTTVTAPLGSIVHPLQHYNVDSKLKQSDYSMTPCQYDTTTDYLYAQGGVNNPLNLYADGKEYSPESRGAFPINVVLNTAGAANAAVQAVVDFVVTEPLFLSPFFFGQKNSSGFYNVTTMQIALQLANGFAYRMWSHLTNGADGAANTGVTITGVTAYLNNFATVPNANVAFTFPRTVPCAMFTYITPQDTMKLSPFESLSYPYFEITAYQTAGAQVNSLAQWSGVISNNIQLSSIPRRLYIFARPNDATLLTAVGSTLPDCYFSLENLSIQFQNLNGILSSATKEQLYLLSAKNGCDMNWIEWSSGPTQNAANLAVQAAGSHAGTVRTMGSVMCLEFGSDIALPSVTDAPGKIGQYNLQVQATFTNPFSVAITPTMYIVVVSEGTFTINKLGEASKHVGDITTNDVLEAQPMQGYDYYDMQDVNGGSFLDGMKEAFKGIKKGFMMPLDFVKGAVPYAKALTSVAGLGGAVHTGGELVSHSDLKQRLANY